MENNFDKNQQMYYEEQPSEAQYEQPLYEKPAPSSTTYFVLSIVGLALSTIIGLPLAGIIVSAIAMYKGKTYFASGGDETGETKASKIMSMLGLITGITFTLVILFIIAVSVIIFIVALASGTSYPDVNSVPGIYY